MKAVDEFMREEDYRGGSNGKKFYTIEDCLTEPDFYEDMSPVDPYPEHMMQGEGKIIK